jgi:hypothetical protein
LKPLLQQLTFKILLKLVYKIYTVIFKAKIHMRPTHICDENNSIWLF